MGFANNIRSSAVPEWKDFYVDYDKLRTKMRHRDFKLMLTNELSKINNFYFLLEKKAVDEKNKIFDDVFTDLPEENFDDLRAHTENVDSEIDVQQWRAIRAVKQSSKGVNAKGKHRGDRRRAGEYNLTEIESVNINNSINLETGDEEFSSSELSYIAKQKKNQVDFGLQRFINMPRGITRRKKEKNITEFLHSLIKITAYRDLNASAMLRLVKKYSEFRKNMAFLDDFTKKLKLTYFYKSTRIEFIRAAIKQLYKRIFAKNQPEKAKMVFNRIKKGLKSSDWLFILSGILMGASCTLALAFRSVSDEKNFLFWGIVNIYIGFILFGVCLKVFKGRQINYKFIFNFDVCSSMNNSFYLLLVSAMLFVHVSGFLFLNSSEEVTTKYISNVCKSAVLILQAGVLVLPFDVLFYNSRLYLISVYAHAILRPLSTVRFRHFYFTDVAQSFSFSFKAILVACGVTNSIVQSGFAVLFPTIRILQCLKRYTTWKFAFPHIMNCAKFSLGIAFNFSKTIEKYNLNYVSYSILFGILNLAAGFMWDLYMDWHIMRSRYMYPRPVYCSIVIFNLLSRSCRSLKYLFNIEYPVLEGLSEVVRRFLWTLIRVEVEHLNNCDELRTKSVIYLTAGELFYKRDQEEIYHVQSETEVDLGTETEDETEFEHGFKARATVDTDSENWGSNGGETGDDEI